MVIFAIHEWFDGIYSHITDRRNELLQRQRCCCTEDALEVVPELELGQELLVWAAAAASVTMYTKVLTPTQVGVGWEGAQQGGSPGPRGRNGGDQTRCGTACAGGGHRHSAASASTVPGPGPSPRACAGNPQYRKSDPETQ
jgi:hypothetical protein